MTRASRTQLRQEIGGPGRSNKYLSTVGTSTTSKVVRELIRCGYRAAA